MDQPQQCDTCRLLTYDVTRDMVHLHCIICLSLPADCVFNEPTQCLARMSKINYV